MRKVTYGAALVAALSIASCSESGKTTDQEITDVSAAKSDSVIVAGEPCDIKLDKIHFTKSINGADTLITQEANGLIRFKVGEKKDYFSDPDGKLSNNTAPILLAKVDNTKPFTIISKVSPGFTDKGLYNAGVLYVYANENLYQKHCFEQDERGHHRVVTVRTNGTSDDANHDVVTQAHVYMKISSDTKTVASYYSLDNKTWQMVRLYKNEYPKDIWLGISAQCPIDTGTVSYFEDISLEEKSVSDFRLGI